MKINYLEIKGFKSIQNVELKDVSPFMVLGGQTVRVKAILSMPWHFYQK